MGICNFKPGTVVLSKAGRDGGKLMAVLEESGGFVTVADGKERPIERPKRKNPKHLQKTDFTVDLQELTNKKLNPEVDTVFLTTSAENMFLSSSLVKIIASHDGDISDFVRSVIHNDIKKRLCKKG